MLNKYAKRGILAAIFAFCLLGFGAWYQSKKTAQSDFKNEKKASIPVEEITKTIGQDTRKVDPKVKEDIAFVQKFFTKYETLLKGGNIENFPFPKAKIKLDPDDGVRYLYTETLDTSVTFQPRYRYYLHRVNAGFFLIAVGGYSDQFGGVFGPLEAN